MYLGMGVVGHSIFHLVAVLAFAQAPRGSSQPATVEQRIFSIEGDTVQHPVSLPPGILKILAQDSDVQQIQKAFRLTSVPSDWFVASVVHLAGPNEDDFVIIGTGPILGANVTTFWCLRPSHDGDFELLLTIAAHDLTIKDERSGGYRNIEVTAATAVRVSKVLYKFADEKYRRW
jgi:hypothetical protein